VNRRDLSHSPETEPGDSEEIFGPMPASQRYVYFLELSNTSQQEQVNKRPRGRGEYGHDAKDIEKYEQMGFVMSGNRRKRKQNQQTVDEISKKAGYKLAKEEKALRETELVARFKEMIQERRGG
jgi:NF-kappa-B-activating protein C-terminal domain